MSTKPRKKSTKRSPRAPSKRTRTRSADDFIDVSDVSADEVMVQVKLLCDNDTDVVFSLEQGKLLLRRQERE